MAEYEVMVVVAMSRFITAADEEEARVLAAREARAVAASQEEHDIGGAAIAEVETIMLAGEEIGLGYLEGRAFVWDGDEFGGGTQPEREMERDQNAPDQT